MVSKNETWSPGVDTGFSTSLNESILQPLSAMDSTDNTAQSDGNSTGATTTSYTTKRTLTIDAGAISKYIIIRFDLQADGTVSRGSASSVSLTTTAYAQITIDSTQQFEASLAASFQTANTSTWSDKSGPESRTCVFKYEPSAGELSTGFTIDLDLKTGISSYDTNGSATGTSRNFYWEVWGA